jgi:hypothetical protein
VHVADLNKRYKVFHQVEKCVIFKSLVCCRVVSKKVHFVVGFLHYHNVVENLNDRHHRYASNQAQDSTEVAQKVGKRQRLNHDEWLEKVATEVDIKQKFPKRTEKLIFNP